MTADAASTAAEADAVGRRHFEAGHFAETAALDARAHAQDPRPIYRYHWAQAERRAGNCPVAAQLYRRYLEHDVEPENEVAAKKNLARCGYADVPVDGTSLWWRSRSLRPIACPSRRRSIVERGCATRWCSRS